MPDVTAEASLVRVAELVREFHDLSAGTPLAGDAQVVCHNDLAPNNTVYSPGGSDLCPVAFIDWDLAAPGRRIHDVAHVCWQYLGLGPGALVGPAARGIRLICDAYRLDGRDEIVDVIMWWQDRCWRGIQAGAVAGDPAMVRLRKDGAVLEVQAALRWVAAHRAELEVL
jgi:aminoglycoside phosphotransferase (APT) family kinase protein